MLDVCLHQLGILLARRLNWSQRVELALSLWTWKSGKLPRHVYCMDNQLANELQEMSSGAYLGRHQSSLHQGGGVAMWACS